MSAHSTDTIFAQATAVGRAGVAIIRISGPQAQSALPAFGFNRPAKPRYAHFHDFVQHEALIDQGLILFFPAPNSFTGEDVIEFQLHGGQAILKKMLSCLSDIPNFRPAEAGEFSRRAFANGKMDLTEAEGLIDLIDAETELQRQQAAILMQGHAKQFYEQLRDRILTPLALMEAYIDFPDEDIPDTVQAEISNQIGELQSDIQQQIKQDKIGEKIREGFVVILLGAPNAGKSSLLNALAKRDAAIVSETAGTTRDLIEIQMDLNGIPVTLIDTAGLRNVEDSIEAEGIRRAKQRAQEADLKLLLFAQNTIPDEESLALIDPKTIILHSKSDLVKQNETLPHQNGSLETIAISDRSENSINLLIDSIKNHLSALIPNNTQRYIVRERHHYHLQNSLSELDLFGSETNLELQCERLRLAATELGHITGHIDVEDLLDVIFSRFCIGK